MMDKKKFITFLVILLVSGFKCLVIADQSEKEKQEKQEKKEEKYFKLWIGYNRYKMEEFNAKLREESNKPINSGFGLGIEFNLIEF